MSQKHNAYPQVRIDPAVDAVVMRLLAKSGYSMSRTAFIDSLIRKGVEVEKREQAIIRKNRELPRQ